MNVECVVAEPAKLGESPMWSVAEQKLYWVDIEGPALHRFDPATGRDESWSMPEEIGSIAVRRDGSLLLGLRNGLAFFDPSSAELTRLFDPEVDKPDNRFTDATTDSTGRFWAGTMRMGTPLDQPQGTLYRINPDLSCRPMIGGLWTTNGLAFSPDGRTMYLSDSNAKVRTIWAFDYDPDTGTPTNRRVFVDTHGMAGRPDGGACDADGCYWMAGIFGGELLRFTPKGTLDLTIKMPCRTPTKIAFGGPGLDVIYVTSLRKEGEEPDPLAGCLFAITGTGIVGMEVPPFAG